MNQLVVIEINNKESRVHFTKASRNDSKAQIMLNNVKVKVMIR